MTWLTQLLRRLRGIVRREPDAELTEELRFHLDMETGALERSGLAPQQARDEARRRLGGFDRHTEDLRDVRGGRSLDALRQDVRYALRTWKRFPGFTAIVIGTLAIAVGATTAMFSVVNTVLLRQLPFPRPDDVVLLYSQNPDRSFPRFSVSYADYLDWRRDTHSFTDIAVFGGNAPTILGGQEPERLAGLTVSSNFFDVLQVHAAVGRLFGPEDVDGASSDAIVLSDGFWRRRFGADPSIVGRRVQLAGRDRTVTGILAPDFMLDGRPIDVVTVLDPATIPGVQSHSQHMVEAIGRLKPGVTLEQAQQDLSAVAARLADNYADIKGWSTNVFRLSDEITRTVRTPLLVLLAAAALVLLIGCINVANLLVTRATARGREVGLRQALGASRGRLVSQFLIETSMLAVAGGLLGIGLAKVGVRSLLSLAPPSVVSQVGTVSLDGRVLAFALGTSLLTAFAVGLWPALRATSPRVSTMLRDNTRSIAGSSSAPRLRRALVIAEISLALVLLVCSTLVTQSLQRMLDVEPGFRVDHLVSMRVTPGAQYTDSALIGFYRQLTTRLAGRGGIEFAAASDVPPLSPGGIVTPIRVLGRPNVGAEGLMCAVTAITPGYFKATGIRLIRGRDMSWSDPNPTLIVTEAAAKQFWPGEDPIGKRIGFGRADTLGIEVVGIASDTRARSLVTDPAPLLYMSYPAAASIARSMLILVRGQGDAASLVAATKATIREIDPRLPVFNAQSMRDIVDQSVAQPRLNSYLLGSFAALALVLAIVGIYGVVAYSVAQRTQEFGVRMALGASESDVFRLVLREGAMLAVIGVIVGLIGATGATSVIQSWLFGIGRSDPLTLVGAATALVAIALMASLVPARRATRVDPLLAMRTE